MNQNLMQSIYPYLSYSSLSESLYDIKNKKYTTGDLYSQEMLKTLKELDKRLKKHIFGQDLAVDELVRIIKSSYAGLRGENKTFANILFTGPTGTGKTELVMQLAKLLDRHLVRYDMSEFQEKVAVTKLIGASGGYVGYEDGGRLVKDIDKHPEAVLLLDEIEKAHSDVYDIFLQVMDYSILTDSKGLKADFSNVIIIMTSNAGARDIGKKQIGFGDQINDDRVMEQAVVQLFSPEFRNRLDAIVQFHHLTRDSIELVVRKEIKFLKSKLNKKKITLSITEDCIMQLVKESYSKEFGARQVARTIEKNLISLLVDEILFGRLVYGGYVKMDWRGDDGYCMDMFEEIIPEKHLDFSQNIGE